MNEVSTLYQLMIRENNLLNKGKIQLKLLAFMQSLSNVGEEGHVYTFWEDNQLINRDQLLEHYIEGLRLLTSIAYELQIDEIKKFEEISSNMNIDDLMFKIYQDVLTFKQSMNPIDLENILNDYFIFGFKLSITIEEIIDKLEN